MRIERGRPAAALFIARPSVRPYLRTGMFRLLSSLLAAMALFLSPLAMANGAGMATPHAPAALEAAAADHCAGGEGRAENEHKAPSKASCAGACAAFMAEGPTAKQRVAVEHAAIVIGKSQLLSGLHPESETPPPRTAPEI